MIALNHTTIKYRAEIDGLRAVAVSAVVLFHAGFNGFSGGYVGVDVFFVISGFLITQIIVTELNSGTFSIISFYERRIRRIIPPLLAVLMLTLVGGYLLLLSDPYRQTAKAALATEAFVSNILFWWYTDYFADIQRTFPLLHTWSLAVEEQFYLFFPVLLILLHRYAGARLKPILLTLLIGLAAAASVSIFYIPSAVFYLFPFRAWELLIGACLAVEAVPTFAEHQSAARQLETGFGALLILAAVYYYTEQTVFPGLAALLPTVGAALIIHGDTAGQTFVGRMLSLKPVVFIGLISYALYLFHWPVFMFLRQYLVTPALAVPAALFAVATSGVLATLSTRFLEAPFRNRRRIGRTTLFASVAAGSIVVSALAFLVYAGSGIPGRFTAQSLAFAVDSRDFDIAEQAMPGPEVSRRLGVK